MVTLMDTPLPDLAGSVTPSSDALGALSRILYASDDFHEVFAAIVTMAVRMVDGCDHASILQRGRDGRYQTAVSTDDIARTIDKLEQLHQQGPCLDAIVEDLPQFEDDLTDPETQWPELAEQVVRQTPVRSAAGFRIIVGEEKVGALNLFSDRVGGISEHSTDQAILLAAFASVAVSALHDRREARTLAAGLKSNREIGKAVGLLMAFHKISDNEAFDLLRKASQDMNIKLAEVAREVVGHHNTGHPAPRIG
jgi:GAF domain-containing protein